MVQFNPDTIQSNIFVHLDSNNAETSIKSNHKIFKLNNAIESIGDNKIIISLLDSIIPHSFYNITALNNTFIYYTGLDISTQKTYTITPGYYTINQILSLIETHLKSSDGYNDANCSVVIEDYINKIKISVPSGQTIIVQGTGLINNILGIREKQIGASQTHTADSVYNANPTTDLKVKLLNVTNQNLDSLGNREETLCRIPINNTFGSWIHYHDDGRHNVLDTNYINKLEILITDEDNNDIDFNGLPFKLSLAFHFIKPKTHKFIPLTERLNFTREN
tara:strand:+ start:516 stop:1349 length:834 start_codon:yes stop_codon:yes gene_type:complete